MASVQTEGSSKNAPKTRTRTTSESYLLSIRNYTKKEKKLKSKCPTLLKQNRKSNKNRRAFTINDVEEIVRELNSITSPALYSELLHKTLRERNKSLLRNVVDELGMQECTRLLREVALIQENGTCSLLLFRWDESARRGQ